MNQVNLQTEECGIQANNALFPDIQKINEADEDNYGLSRFLFNILGLGLSNFGYRKSSKKISMPKTPKW
jgi:hypothetical protein